MSHSHLTKDLDRLTVQVTKLAELMQKSQRTQWGPILAGLALAFSGVGAGVGYVNRFEEMQREVNRRLFDYHHAQSKDITLLLDRVSKIEIKKEK